MRRIRLILMLLFWIRIAFAQQTPMYTQYNFNMQTINPAYAGTWESMGYLVLGRYQWLGMEGAPTTYTFSVQSPVKNQNIAWGVDVVADKIGKEKSITLSGDYSYRLRVSWDSYLRMGLKLGISSYSNPLTRYKQYTGDDIYQEDVEVKLIPNFGVGLMLYAKDYYIGLSVPKIIQTDLYVTVDNVNYTSCSEMRHFYFSAGYVFKLSDFLKFKPTGLVKAVIGSPVQFDITANFLLKDKIWFGAMYRWGDSYGFIGQFLINRRMRFGYAFDFTISKLRTHGSHELMFSYELGYKRKWSTPRMF